MSRPRPHCLRWLLLGCLVAEFLVTTTTAQLQGSAEKPKPAPAPAEANSAPVAQSAASGSDFAAEANANYEKIRSEVDRMQRERTAETQASIKAAQQANAALAERLDSMEKNIESQRVRETAYLRDYTHSSLLIAGGLGLTAVLVLAAVVGLQIRAGRQQAAALAKQAEVLAVIPQLLPQLAAAREPSHPTIASAHSRFHDAVDRVKQQLDEIETLAEDAAGTTVAPPNEKTPVSFYPPATAGAPGPVAADDTPVRRNPLANERPASAPRSAPTTPRPTKPDPAAMVVVEPVVPEAAPETEPREDAATLIAKGLSLLQENQAAPALAYLERATNLEPGNVQAWLKRGVALEKLERLHDALSAYDMAAALEPSLPVVHLSCAGVLNRLQRFDDALRCYERALAAQNGTGPVGDAPAVG